MMAPELPLPAVLGRCQTTGTEPVAPASRAATAAAARVPTFTVGAPLALEVTVTRPTFTWPLSRLVPMIVAVLRRTRICVAGGRYAAPPVPGTMAGGAMLRPPMRAPVDSSMMSASPCTAAEQPLSRSGASAAQNARTRAAQSVRSAALGTKAVPRKYAVDSPGPPAP